MTRALTIVVLAVVGGALATVAARSAGVRPLAAFPVTWEVTKGKVWGIPIGASTGRVVEGLRARNRHRTVLVTLLAPVRVRQGDDIGALESVKGILVSPGDVRFYFEGDTIVSRSVDVGRNSPVLQSMKSRLSAAQTRAEVLPLLAELLAADSRRVAIEHDARAGWFDLDALSAADKVALDELGSWSVSDRDMFGWWEAEFMFREARLTKVVVSWRPFELAL